MDVDNPFLHVHHLPQHGGRQVVRRVEQAPPTPGTPPDITPQNSADLSDRSWDCDDARQQVSFGV